MPLIPTRGLLRGSEVEHADTLVPSGLSSFCKLGTDPSSQLGVPPYSLAPLPADFLAGGSSTPAHDLHGPPAAK